MTKDTKQKSSKSRLPKGLENLGPTIQRLRKAAGFSLQELSGESGIAKSILSRIENNETNPTLSTIWNLSKALDTNIDELLKNLENRPPLITHHFPKHLPVLFSEDGLCTLKIIGDIETVEWAQSYELHAKVGGILRSEAQLNSTDIKSMQYPMLLIFQN